MRLRRAKVLLCCSLLAGGLFVAFDLPIGELVHQRSDLATVDAELRAASRTASHLRQDIASLRQSETVANIAHQEYGLVSKGQKSYVVLPASGSSPSGLSSSTISKSDLVPSSLSPYGVVKAAVARPATSLWHRVLQRLEFWH